MSYRHTSYRKMSTAVAKTATARAKGEPYDLHRSEMDRVLHWSNQPPLPKPPGWGRPKSRRV